MGSRSMHSGHRFSRILGGERWSLVENLAAVALSDSERAIARAHMLLERYGIVSREVSIAEAISGGFAAIYRVLKMMEEVGKVRRGYFVAGLSGSQFGHTGAIDRLRSVSVKEGHGDTEHEPELRALAAVDPANPYGALLPWPATNSGDALRPRPIPGAWVRLVGGRPAVYLAPNGHQLLTFAAAAARSQAELEIAFRGLQSLGQGNRRRVIVVEKVDGILVRNSPHYALLRTCGFAVDYRGLVPAPAGPNSC